MLIANSVTVTIYFTTFHKAPNSNAVTNSNTQQQHITPQNSHNPQPC